MTYDKKYILKAFQYNVPKVQEVIKKYSLRDGTIKTCSWYILTLPKAVGKELELKNNDTIYFKKVNNDWILTKKGGGIRTKVNYTDRYLFTLKKEIVNDLNLKKGDKVSFIFLEEFTWKMVKENDRSIL